MLSFGFLSENLKTGNIKRMMRRIVPILIILFTISNFANAQHTVSGIVSDKADVTLLHEGVTVYIPELNKSDISKEGIF